MNDTHQLQCDSDISALIVIGLLVKYEIPFSYSKWSRKVRHFITVDRSNLSNQQKEVLDLDTIPYLQTPFQKIEDSECQKS